MEGKEAAIFSLDDVPLKSKVRDLVQFAGYDTDKYSVDNFQDIALDVFIGTYQSMYPFDKMPQGTGLSTDPLTDPLLSDILQEGQEMKVQHIINGLKRALKRLYGASTLGDTNNPKKSMSTVVRPRSASATRGRPKSAGGNKKRSSPQKGKSIKDYSSEDIFRRSLGGTDRSGLVNRVLTKSASSTLTTPEDILLTNIKANAGHSIKLIESFTAADVVEGDVKAMGIMMGLLYQEWYRMCVLDTDGTSRAKDMMAYFRSPSPPPMLSGTNGSSSRSATPTSQTKKGAKAGAEGRRRASVFVPSGGFKKDPRNERHSSRMVPLKYQHDPKMRERETMYIISLHTVDPLRAAKLEEEKLARENAKAKAKHERRKTVARERAEKRLQRELDEEVEKLMAEGEGDGEAEEKDHGADRDAAPHSRSRSASRGRGPHKQITDDGEEIPYYLQKPRKAKKKNAPKMKVKKVNTRSSDTPSNPFVEHVVSWEPPVLPKGEEIGPRDAKRMRVRRQVERHLRTISPDGKRLPSPVEIPSRSPSPTVTATKAGMDEPTAEEKYEKHPHRHVHHHPEGKEHEEHPHRHVHHHPEDKEHEEHPHRHVHHHPEDKEGPSSPQRVVAERTMDFVASALTAKLSLGSEGALEGAEHGAAEEAGEGHVAHGAGVEDGEDEDDAYADEYDDFEDYGEDEWEDEGKGVDEDNRHPYTHVADGASNTATEFELNERGSEEDKKEDSGGEEPRTYARYGYVPPPTKTVRATSPTLYQPKKHLPPPGYRAHDPDEWGPPPRKKSHPTELRDIVDYHSRHKGFGLFLLDKLVHKTRNATGGGAVNQGAGGEKVRPSSATPALGRKRKKKKKKGGSRSRSRSISRSGKSGKSKHGNSDSQGGGRTRDSAGKGHALEASYDSGADLLSEASAATEDDKPAKPLPHHRGPAFPAHPMDKAYLEASMSVEVLGGEISDIVDPRQIPRVKAHLPRKGKGRGRSGRPVSAPAGRRPTTGRVVEGVEERGEEEEEDEDVFSRLYKAAVHLPRDADFTDPAYLRSMGFEKAEIRELLRQSAPQTHLMPGGVFKASRGGKAAYVAYDSQTGRINTVTEQQQEENERRWKESNQVTDDDLDAFRLHDGKMSPPVDVKGNLQWAPVSSHTNLFGSPVKHMAAAMPTSPQWPGYNTGKRTDEWVARARRQVRVEKFSQVGGVLVGHDQNHAIAAFAVESERILSDTSKLLQYRAVMAAMRSGDVVVMIEHCHMCHLHATTLRHREEEYSLIADQFLKVLVETLHAEGVCARVGVLRFGTPLAELGPPPPSAEKVVASASSRQLGASPDAHSHATLRVNDSLDQFSSTAPALRPDTGDLSGTSPPEHGGLDNPSGFTATTMAGQDLEHAPKPLSDLSTGLRGFLPQQRHSPGDLKSDTEQQIKLNRLSSPHRSGPKTAPKPSGTPQKVGRLGAFEIQIVYRALEEEEGGESTSPSGAVSRELLHSKLASQRWPSRSVVARRCRSFLSRHNVPTYSSKGGQVPSEAEGEDGKGSTRSFSTDGPYPTGWHVPLSATDVGRSEEYAYSAPQDGQILVPGVSPGSADDASALAGIQWVYDTSSAASMAFFAEGDRVWVTGMQHPLGGCEAGWLPGTVKAVQEKEVMSAKGGKSHKESSQTSLEVLLKYHETPVTVPAAKCLAATAPSLPAVCSRMYPQDGAMPLPLAVLLFHGLPDDRKGTEAAKVGESGLWRVLHRLDRKDDSTGVVSVCRHSMFHQLRNLARQVGEKMKRDAAKGISAKSNHGTVVDGSDGSDGCTVRLPSGDVAVLEHAYSEPVLAWLFGEAASSGTQAARRKIESDKLVNTGDIEALAVVMMKKRGVSAARVLAPASPAPASSAAPLSPAYLEETFEALSPVKAALGGEKKDHKDVVEARPQSKPEAVAPAEQHHAAESKESTPPAVDNADKTETANAAGAREDAKAATESQDDAGLSGFERDKGAADAEKRHKLGILEDASAEESNDLIGGSPDHSTSLSQSQAQSGPSASRTSRETEGTAEARHDAPHPFNLPSESATEHQAEPPAATFGAAVESMGTAVPPSTKEEAEAEETRVDAQVEAVRGDLEDSQISGVTMPGMGLGSSLEAIPGSDSTTDTKKQGQQHSADGLTHSTPRGQVGARGAGEGDEAVKGGEEGEDIEAMTTPPPSLSQNGKSQSQMSQISASITNYLGGDDDGDGGKSQSSGELSDSAMQALMTASSPSLLAVKAEEEKKQMEKEKTKNTAPKVTIVRDIRADFSPASLSPESSTDDDERKPKVDASSKHMADVQTMLDSPKSSENDGDDEYGSDFDD